MQGQSVELCSRAGPQRDGIGLEYEPGREMSDFKALRWFFLPGSTSPKELRRSRAHKFARANDFRDLTPPLTNFSGRNSRDARDLKRPGDQDGGRRLSRCVLRVGEA